MNVVLSSRKWQFALRYLDNVIILSTNADEHISDVCTVLSLFHKSDVTLNPKKCHFFPEKSDYLGHVILPV